GSERFVVDGKVEVNAGCAVGPHGLAPVIDRPGFFYDHKLVAAGVAHVQSVHDPLAEVQFRVVAVGIAAYVGVFKAIRNRVETGQRICARPVNAQLNSRDKHLAILKDQARTAFEGAGVDSFEIDCGDIKGAMHPFTAPLQGVEIVGGIHVGAAGSGAQVSAGAKRLICWGSPKAPRSPKATSRTMRLGTPSARIVPPLTPPKAVAPCASGGTMPT